LAQGAILSFETDFARAKKTGAPKKPELPSINTTQNTTGLYGNKKQQHSVYVSPCFIL